MKRMIRAEKIIKKFNNNETVLKGIDLSISSNSFTVILGQSGSGKSTLLNVLSGLLRPTSGKVFYNDIDITKLSKRELSNLKRNELSIIFQNYLLLADLTAEENIKIGMSPQKVDLSYNEITKILGIEDILSKFPSQLSGGQQQRVAIARAIIKKPHVLFCDEATGSLDEENSKIVVALLHEIKKRYGVTVIFTTHNLKIAETADRVITVKDGAVYKDIWNETPLSANEIDWEIN
ncbi:ABC transporter ATP-binding protein [Paenibacillus sp. N3/727]|uniref:ABC transporter ATP-binding protein n=1 Tax=Paenibacillus sp. N3/727 TaxID=2925845 RepID=UPI001F534C7E|nr:ABC transporter ATP-binding protein [Paenibacillus sp. N3/727]UNK17310.1 ABC transporter ATP-binding protein [Paenibacillus sp. N3/727]